MPAHAPRISTCGCFEMGFRHVHSHDCPRWGKSVRPRSKLGKLQAENEWLRALLIASRALMQQHKVDYPDEIDDTLGTQRE